jgi:uncharacterized spore protein YtfJ
MVNDETEAKDEAREAAEKERVTDRLVQRLVDRIGGRTGVSALFGQPVERGDTTVIPVGRVRWFFGAGEGSSSLPADENQVGSGSGGAGGASSGSGGGGGAIADPVGYVEMGPSGIRFRPIVGLPPNPLAILAVGLAVALVLRSLARVMGR